MSLPPINTMFALEEIRRAIRERAKIASYYASEEARLIRPRRNPTQLAHDHVWRLAEYVERSGDTSIQIAVEGQIDTQDRSSRGQAHVGAWMITNAAAVFASNYRTTAVFPHERTSNLSVRTSGLLQSETVIRFSCDDVAWLGAYLGSSKIGELFAGIWAERVERATR